MASIYNSFLQSFSKVEGGDNNSSLAVLPPWWVGLWDLEPRLQLNGQECMGPNPSMSVMGPPSLSKGQILMFTPYRRRIPDWVSDKVHQAKRPDLSRKRNQTVKSFPQAKFFSAKTRNRLQQPDSNRRARPERIVSGSLFWKPLPHALSGSCRRERCQALTADAQVQERAAPDPGRGNKMVFSARGSILKHFFFFLSPLPKKKKCFRISDSNLGDSKIINWDSCEFSEILNHWFSGLSLTLFTRFK